MTKLKIINPRSGASAQQDIPENQVSAFIGAENAKGRIVVDLGSGNILTNMPEQFGAVAGAWEGLKTGATAGIPLIGDAEAREREAEVERQRPGAYAGGKMVGEIGRDVALQLGLARVGAPKQVVTAAPILAATLQGAAEEGDTRPEILTGAVKGLGASLIGEALGRGAGALVKAPLRTVGSAVSDFVRKNLPGALPAAPTPDIPPTALEALPEAAARRDMALAQKAKIDQINSELAKMKASRKIAEDLVAENNPAASKAMAEARASTLLLRKMLEKEGMTPAQITDIITGRTPVVRWSIKPAVEAANAPLLGGAVLEAATARAESDLAAEAAALSQQYRQAAGEAAEPATARAASRAVLEYAIPPSAERTSRQPGAKYGAPEWAKQLLQAGLSPEKIAEIEASIARLPGERIPPAGERETDVSPIMRLQRPPVADDATLRAAGAAARQLAAGQVQILNEYYRRTNDPAVIPDMQRLGEWVGGVRK